MSIDEVIEELETIRTRVQPRALTPQQYQAVGWLDRPLRAVIDQCRQEQESLSWAERHARDIAALDPRLAIPEPLPREMEASP